MGTLSTFADGETGCQSSETVFRKAEGYTQEPRVITVDKMQLIPKLQMNSKLKKSCPRALSYDRKSI